MGFTRYWNVTGKEFDNEFLADVRNTIGLAKKHFQVHLADGLGEGEPIITRKKIVLNGSRILKEDYETFYLCPGETGFNFTKTARKPYDIVVATILRLAEEKGIVKEVESDNPPEEEPKEIEALYGMVKNS